MEWNMSLKNILILWKRLPFNPTQTYYLNKMISIMNYKKYSPTPWTGIAYIDQVGRPVNKPAANPPVVPKERTIVRYREM